MDNIPALHGYPFDPSVAARHRLNRAAKRAARAASRQNRRGIARLWGLRWWQRRAPQRPAVGAPRLVAATPIPPPSVELAHVLEEAAHRITEKGTVSERRLLEAMGEVAAHSAPGAAAALVDLDGTETSRLRAFGLVHTHILGTLGPREHAWLLDLLEGEGGLQSPDRVA